MPEYKVPSYHGNNFFRISEGIPLKICTICGKKYLGWERICPKHSLEEVLKAERAMREVVDLAYAIPAVKEFCKETKEKKNG